MQHQGLPSGEAAKRLKQYGKNKLIDARHVTLLDRIINQIKSPLIIVLAVVSLVSLLLHEVEDAIIIGIVVVFNTIVGIVQERKADNAIESLATRLAPQTKVYRDGKLSILDAALLVPGDIVLLEAGDRVPADGTLIEIKNLQVNEAQLSGEAFPVMKSEGENAVFMGTIVVTGRGVMEVIQTGMQTKLGEITKYVSEKGRDLTPLEEKFEALTKKILVIVLCVCIGVTLLGYFIGYDLKTIFETSVSLALSAIPEGLPVVVTLTLSIGVYRMSRKNAVIRNLSSASTLAGVDVICTDKTGTITEGKIILDECITLENLTDFVKMDEPLNLAVLCNDAKLEGEGIGDLLDVAILKYAKNKRVDVSDLHKNYPRVNEIPFDSEFKYHATLHQTAKQGEYLLIVKGAADVLVDACANTPASISAIKHKFHELGETGKRVILIATKMVKTEELTHQTIQNLTFEGLLVFSDPLRKDVHESVERCRKSGIKVIMITGDHATTARNIASEAGICNAATCSQIEGSELKSKGADTLKDEIMQVNIISRADPIDKVTIIEALHHNDKLVAMTGDGVNDAPALVKADIGIAMGKNGTDAARESADMVLVDNKFSTIVNGIEQARIVFENLRKTTSYLFSTSFGEIMTIILSLIIGLPLPITAVQILWLNLITDGFLDVAIATEGKHGDLLRFSSKKYQKGIVNGLMLTRIIILGSVMAIGSIIYFEKQLTTNDLVYAQTATFIVMAMYQWFNALNARSEDNSIFAIGIFKNKFVWGALFIEVVLCLFAVYTPFMNRILGTTPVSANVWFIASLFAVLIVFIEEGRKFLFKIYKDTKADKNVLNIS